MPPQPELYVVTELEKAAREVLSRCTGEVLTHDGRYVADVPLNALGALEEALARPAPGSSSQPSKQAVGVAWLREEVLRIMRQPTVVIADIDTLLLGFDAQAPFASDDGGERLSFRTADAIISTIGHLTNRVRRLKSRQPDEPVSVDAAVEAGRVAIERVREITQTPTPPRAAGEEGSDGKA